MLNEGTKQICTPKHSGSHLTKCHKDKVKMSVRSKCPDDIIINKEKPH